MVIGHTNCGVQGMDGSEMLHKLVERGGDKEHIAIVRHSGIDLENGLVALTVLKAQCGIPWKLSHIRCNFTDNYPIT